MTGIPRTLEGSGAQGAIGTSGHSRLAKAKWFLLLMWVVAGVANANGFIMGGAPTALGVGATIVAACAWLLAGGIAGSRTTSFVRFATVFWGMVVAGTPLVFWALTVAPGRAVSQGGFVLPLLLFTLMSPLYGLYALLPPWEPIVQGAVIGAAVFAMTLVAYFGGRRIAEATVRRGSE
jgi:hypothetical protein